jgi:hypothetical protein
MMQAHGFAFARPCCIAALPDVTALTCVHCSCAASRCR